MTLSILAFDPDTHVVGAAVTSCVLAAGRRVLTVRPGVGAAATQASSEITWGTEILASLEQGATPDDAIARFRADDVQLAAIDFDGNAGAYTGSECAAHAGHRVHRLVTAQVNTAARGDAVERMLDAFHRSEGQPLAERLVAALAASGDDARGRQSAAVLVTGVGPMTGYADEPHVDLRVDESREPVQELGRLLAVHRAHCEMRIAFESHESDLLARLTPLYERHPDDPHLRSAIERLRPSTP